MLQNKALLLNELMSTIVVIVTISLQVSIFFKSLIEINEHKSSIYSKHDLIIFSGLAFTYMW